MATLTVQKGLQAIARSAPDHAWLIVGQHKELKNLPYSALAHAFGPSNVSEDRWEEAKQRLPATGSLSLQFNHAKVVSIPDASAASRHNSPSQSLSMTKEIRCAAIAGEATSLSIVIVCPYAHALASVAATARVFPQFTRKSKVGALREVFIDVVFTDKQQDEVPEVDWTVLRNVVASVRTASRLVDTPANELTTDAFVEEALAVAKGLGVEATVIRGEELKLKGFGGIYNVGKAGPTPPAFVVLSHNVEKAESTYALVGKGIVYDTGGMQIKGKTGMPTMKHDMGGAAALLNAFTCLVSAGFSQNLHCLLCIAENNISPIANKPDDIITLLSGKTVEINNTDAEGRLVLADGVYYAKQTLKANYILDMATLTGAQSYATGKYHAAFLTNSEDEERKTLRAARFSGDLAYPLVFAPDLHFTPDLASPVADMKNAALGKQIGPASAIAAHFIGTNIEFGEGGTWIHVDMAAPATEGERGTGYGVALVSALLGEHTDSPLLQSATA